MKKLALLNSTVLTSNGIFSLKDISLEKARELVKENKNNILNCIGHEPTANTLSKLLGLEIQYERNTLEQEKKAISFSFEVKWESSRKHNFNRRRNGKNGVLIEIT